jgi:hypothetical protein
VLSNENTTERWKAVVDYEWLYSVSNWARVRRDATGRILKPQITARGYAIVTLYKHRIPKRFFVHRIVGRAFIGQCPQGLVTNHRDGVKLNNYPENLEWVTQRENVDHEMRMGLCPSGDKHWARTQPEKLSRGQEWYETHMTKLTADDVRAIRKLYEKGYEQWQIAAAFSISRPVVSRIVTRKRWKHVC